MNAKTYFKITIIGLAVITTACWAILFILFVFTLTDYNSYGDLLSRCRVILQENTLYCLLTLLIPIGAYIFKEKLRRGIKFF